MENITIKKPLDLHVHVRQGSLQKLVLPFTAAQFQSALLMPNTSPALDNSHFVTSYHNEVIKNLPVEGLGSTFTPLTTFKITENVKPEDVATFRNCLNCVAGKLYPTGVTTNSTDGISDFKKVIPVLEAMADSGFVLCVHGEKPGVPSLEAEIAFINIIEQWMKKIPTLKVVVEHVSTDQMVSFIEHTESPNIGATITLHHLMMTTDDVFGKPHNFCKPVIKSDLHRSTLRRVVMDGDPRFFFGTDSAPHDVVTKECCNSAAGVFSAPVAVPALAKLFEELDCLDKLESFTSDFGAQFYNLTLNGETLTLVKEPMEVPAIVKGDNLISVVPYLAGQILPWSIQNQ